MTLRSWPEPNSGVRCLADWAMQVRCCCHLTFLFQKPFICQFCCITNSLWISVIYPTHINFSVISHWSCGLLVGTFHMSSYSRSWAGDGSYLRIALLISQKRIGPSRPRRAFAQEWCVCGGWYLYWHSVGQSKSPVQAWQWVGCTLPLHGGAEKHVARVRICRIRLLRTVIQSTTSLLGIDLLRFFWHLSPCPLLCRTWLLAWTTLILVQGILQKQRIY